MNEFVFEIRLSNADLEGDEFWEKALERDGTGLGDLTETLQELLEESGLLNSETDVKKVLTLKRYTKL